MKKDPYGVFEVVIPAKDGQPAIAHNSKIKVGKLQSAAT
jgi:1,4-alpha-glucan branching enzyme